jgi:hypothetical protein
VTRQNRWAPLWAASLCVLLTPLGVAAQEPASDPTQTNQPDKTTQESMFRLGEIVNVAAPAIDVPGAAAR